MENNLLYAKVFENGKIYIGITNNFNNRMYQHKYDAYKYNSKLPVHRAMRKYNHRTEIWAEGIDDRELIELLEIQTIKQLKENGIGIYNVTDGGESIMGILKLKGENSPIATSKEYYESHPVERGCFKKVCRNKNWNMEDFMEIEDKQTFHYHKKYFYINKHNDVKDNTEEIKEYIKDLDITWDILMNDMSLELYDLVMDIYLQAYMVNDVTGLSLFILQEHYSKIKSRYVNEENDFKNLIKLLPYFVQKFSINSERTIHQGGDLMLSVVNNMIQKFRININQIIANSDNTIEDIINESCIVMKEHKEAIECNNNVFINELRKKCLRFNKYGKRIESKKQWEIFNNREQAMVEQFNNEYDINEDVLCQLLDVKEIIGEESYKFLIDYYNFGSKETSLRYHISEPTVKKRVNEMISKVRRKLC